VRLNSWKSKNVCVCGGEREKASEREREKEREREHLKQLSSWEGNNL
jgi:hypothetical protein